MIHKVVLAFDAVEDVLRITMAHRSKTAVIEASRQLQEALRQDPHNAGIHLHEGLYFVDRDPLRAFFTIDDNEATVEIVHVKPL